MELWSVIVRFFQGGGEFMLPIAVVLVIGLAIAIERYIYLTRAAIRNRALWNEVVPLLAQATSGRWCPLPRSRIRRSARS